MKIRDILSKMLLFRGKWAILLFILRPDIL